MIESGVVHVVDDDPAFRSAIARCLHAAGFEVTVFQSSAELLARVSKESRGCVLADLQMPPPDGLELQHALLRQGVVMPLVFLTGHADLRSAVSALKNGAVDFLEKCAPREMLFQAIQRALEQDAAARSAREHQEQLRSRFAALTRREGEVLTRVIRGKMNKQIAAELRIHERTVKLHRTAITSKVGVRSVAELTALAHQARLPDCQP
jgi:FixJ family two-component response regulator